MSIVLIDSSTWISFFRGESKAEKVLDLIESNRVCTNDLIMAELIPSIIHKKENQLVTLLESIQKIELLINWKQIIEMQNINLMNGINRVGIPDLIIAQNFINLFTFDKHFKLMSKLHNLTFFVKYFVRFFS